MLRVKSVEFGLPFFAITLALIPEQYPTKMLTVNTLDLPSDEEIDERRDVVSPINVPERLKFNLQDKGRPEPDNDIITPPPHFNTSRRGSRVRFLSPPPEEQLDECNKGLLMFLTRKFMDPKVYSPQERALSPCQFYLMGCGVSLFAIDVLNHLKEDIKED